MPKVSVILTSFNHEKYIREAIESTLNQTFTDFELIIWDDCSSDNSWDLINQYTDPRIKAYRNEINIGGNLYVNKAISDVVSGQYIAMHHSDDVWELNKLQQQVDFLDTCPEIGAVFTNALAINEDSLPFADKQHPYSNVFNKTNRTRHEWLRLFFNEGNALCHPSMLIRKQCYVDCGLYRPMLGQLPDFDMWIRLCLKYEIYVLPEKLVKFRVRDNEANTSGNRPETRIRLFYESYKLLANYLKISSFDEMVKIFPSARKYYRDEETITNFVLAMVALEEPSFPFVELFALDILFEAISDAKQAEQIKKLYNFDHHSFIQLTAKLDVFSREKVTNLCLNIATLNQAATERETHIAALNQAATERETHIAALNQATAERDTHIANLNQLVAERDAHITNLNQIYNEALKDIRGSSSWRITAPMRYVSSKAKNIVSRIKSIPSIIYSTDGVIVNIKKLWRVFSQEGWSGVKQRISNRRKITLATVDMNVGRNSESNNIITNATQISHACFQSVTPLRTYFLPESQAHRVNIVTDSISSGSLFGGVGTTLIFAALLANKLNAQLRIITRTERAKLENVDHILSLYGIKLNHEIQFKFAAFWDQKYELDITKNDLFITTSWWTTAATLPSVPNDKIIYLLQEDERMFYSFGDERFRCETILRNRDIRFIINTKLLFDHFVKDGFDNIFLQAAWFEPAFPSQIFHPRPKNQNEKHKFFFYARPNNQRNLFYLGIEVIEQAVLQQVIDLDLWEIYLVGKDIPNITFGNGYVPTKCQNLTWSEYADLVGTIDLGLSLMYTPHPSYPPLDLVASGAVVVTNQFANKRDLSCYSENLICVDANCDTLVEALRKAVTIAMDSNIREQNYHNNGLLTDWHQALDEIIQQLSGEL
jgi:glycosyltransferase involved in cell wall biosynthesis